MKGFYKGLLAATGLFAVYVAGTGATVYANAMRRPSSRPDRNYDPDEKKDYIVPTEKSSVYGIFFYHLLYYLKCVMTF